MALTGLLIGACLYEQIPSLRRLAITTYLVDSESV